MRARTRLILSIVVIASTAITITGCQSFGRVSPEQRAELATVKGSLGYALDAAIGLLEQLREERSMLDDNHPSAPTYDRLIGYLENGVRGGQDADAILSQITNEDGSIDPGKAAQAGAAFLPPPWNGVALSVLGLFGVGGAEGTRRYVKVKRQASDAEGTLLRMVKAVEDAKPKLNGTESVLLDAIGSATTSKDKATIENIRKVVLG